MSPLSDKDRRLIWHPFTQHHGHDDFIPVVRAEGARLIAENGQTYLDLISSWWSCVHGHGHPALVAALHRQSTTLNHVMFAGFTHAPAITLAEKLLALFPDAAFGKVFFSDNGSTAVEVALKMAYQYWQNQGDTRRTDFVSLDGGYHGDTLGAMAVGVGSGYFNLYRDLLARVHLVPAPVTWIGDPAAAVAQKENRALAALDTLIADHGDTLAALILEPIVQGASGMRLMRPDFVRRLCARARAAGILVIFDEVATGFGRTGQMFAAHTAEFMPDLLCLSKGLTGGMLPLAVTICAPKIYDSFLGDDMERALAHGHTFTANPLACAVACASLDVFATEHSLEHINRIQAFYQTQLPTLQAQPRIEKIRTLGPLLAFDIPALDTRAARRYFLSRGLNIRPLGNTVYLLPPYCVTNEELEQAFTAIEKLVAGEGLEPPTKGL